ncbi:MAG TPA: hypothetical protein VFH73_22875 [Polyangia bacterium]|nr:hypothetical protein [Polyangia bacterium]
MTPDLLDRLFSVPLKGFIEERRRVVGELKAAGQAQQAKEVDKIAKPTVSAWATNQLARRDPKLIEELGQVAASLRDVQLGGGGNKDGDSRYGDAVARQREILKKLRTDAEEVLTSSGHAPSPQVVERTIRNLREGVADETTRDTVARGRLTEDLEAVDFAALVAEVSTTASGGARTSARAKEPAARAPSTATRKEALLDANHGKEAAQQRARARAAAEREVAKLRTAATTAEHVLDRHRRAVENTRQELSTLEKKAEAARLESDRLSRALDAAQATLRKLPAD